MGQHGDVCKWTKIDRHILVEGLKKLSQDWNLNSWESRLLLLAGHGTKVTGVTKQCDFESSGAMQRTHMQLPPLLLHGHSAHICLLCLKRYLAAHWTKQRNNHSMSRHHGSSARRGSLLLLWLHGPARAACHSRTPPHPLAGVCPGTQDLHTTPNDNPCSPDKTKKDTEWDKNLPAEHHFTSQPWLFSPQSWQPELRKLLQVTVDDVSGAKVEVLGTPGRWGSSAFQCSHHLCEGELNKYK